MLRRCRHRQAVCKIAKEDNFIRWTDEMKTSFEEIKQAICTTCELYIRALKGCMQFMWMHLLTVSVQF